MKIAKQRITFLGCTNAAGSHKLKPLIIRKANRPRYFKNVCNPVVYKNNANPLMKDIFKDWFF